MATNKSEYKINGISMDKQTFDKFLSGLKELPHTWFCAETKTGGITGYDAVNENNQVFEVRFKSDNGNTLNTIIEKIEY
jgi:hypothetical protein